MYSYARPLQPLLSKRQILTRQPASAREPRARYSISGDTVLICETHPSYVVIQADLHRSVSAPSDRRVHVHACLPVSDESRNNNPLIVYRLRRTCDRDSRTAQSRKGQSKPGLYRGRSTGKETRNASKRETRDAHNLVTGYTYYNCVFVTKGVDATNRRCSKKSDRRTERQPKKKPKKAEKSNSRSKQNLQSTPPPPLPPRACRVRVISRGQ